MDDCIDRIVEKINSLIPNETGFNIDEELANKRTKRVLRNRSDLLKNTEEISESVKKKLLEMNFGYSELLAERSIKFIEDMTNKFELLSTLSIEMCSENFPDENESIIISSIVVEIALRQIIEKIDEIADEVQLMIEKFDEISPDPHLNPPEIDKRRFVEIIIIESNFSYIFSRLKRAEEIYKNAISDNTIFLIDWTTFPNSIPEYLRENVEEIAKKIASNF